jgi:hypothetical protein
MATGAREPTRQGEAKGFQDQVSAFGNVGSVRRPISASKIVLIAGIEPSIFCRIRTLRLQIEK